MIFVLSMKEANALSSGRDNYFHVFAAAGMLGSIGSIRVGIDEWELGLLNPRAVGFAKFFTSGSIYGGFGFVILDANNSQGIFGGAGLMWDFWKIFSLRLEFNTSVAYDGFMSENALLGLAVHF